MHAENATVRNTEVCAGVWTKVLGGRVITGPIIVNIARSQLLARTARSCVPARSIPCARGHCDVVCKLVVYDTSNTSNHMVSGRFVPRHMGAAIDSHADCDFSEHVAGSTRTACSSVRTLCSRAVAALTAAALIAMGSHVSISPMPMTTPPGPLHEPPGSSPAVQSTSQTSFTAEAHDWRCPIVGGARSSLPSAGRWVPGRQPITYNSSCAAIAAKLFGTTLRLCDVVGQPATLRARARAASSFGWVASGCDAPMHFDAAAFAAALAGGRRLMIVGDSISKQHAISLTCLLHAHIDVPATLRLMRAPQPLAEHPREHQHTLLLRGGGLVQYVFNDRLVDVLPATATSPAQVRRPAQRDAVRSGRRVESWKARLRTGNASAGDTLVLNMVRASEGLQKRITCSWLGGACTDCTTQASTHAHGAPSSSPLLTACMRNHAWANLM